MKTNSLDHTAIDEAVGSLGLMARRIVHRHPANPIITAEEFPGANTIFNSAIIRTDEDYQAILRVELNTGDSCLVHAQSSDGICFQLDPEPLTFPDREPFTSQYTEHSYDPRLTELDGVYYLTYAVGTPWGAAIGMASTLDFRQWHHYDLTSPAKNRNCVLFSQKITGRFARLERPFGDPWNDQAHIWYAESTDLEYWGHYRHVMGPSQRWDSQKVGAGPPPILTDEGWLLIYHGAHKTCSGLAYAMGVCLLDREEPWKVLHRPKRFLMQPLEMYERVGDVPNCLFPTGAFLDPSGEEVWIYYGAADTSVALATAKLADLLAFCMDPKA